MTPGEVEEVKRHFNVVAEQLGGQIRLVAEGVSGLDARIDREIRALREEMRSEFEETRAMIRLSYAELDQRIRRLEDGFATLETRVGRLEAR